MKRTLSPPGIETPFPGLPDAERASPGEVEEFDLKQLDRIPRSQLQSLHSVHEGFVRNLASSPSAYLRSYVTLNLVSIEQISYAEFLEGLVLPTCIAYLGLQPYDGTAILELSNSLMFGLLELLLGSKGRSSKVVDRKITDIEKTLVQTLLLVVLRDLRESWSSVAQIAFAVQSLASEPQLIHVLSPNEAVIVIAIEVRVGSASGLMNLAIPSIFIKRLRNRFDQIQQVRKAESTGRDRLRMTQLIETAKLRLDIQIPAGTISGKTLLELEAGEVLGLEFPLGGEVVGFLNQKEKWLGHLGVSGAKLAFELTQIKKPQEQGTALEKPSIQGLLEAAGTRET
ncbi:MAG: FliM/FliN family flagellar motor switch protein [Acidobacteriota bacterium]|nr:FliM/FliN family flagellar motor switch protein [Acidobacteriota bacterium]